MNYLKIIKEEGFKWFLVIPAFGVIFWTFIAILTNIITIWLYSIYLSLWGLGMYNIYLGTLRKIKEYKEWKRN